MSDKHMKDQIPPGFALRQILRGHKAEINLISWSPNGYILASPSFDQTIRLWDTQKGEPLLILRGHSDSVYSVTWSPNGEILASASSDKTILTWSAKTGDLLESLKEISDMMLCVAWSPDGQLLASGSFDRAIYLWDVQTRKPVHAFVGHTGSVNSIAWSPDGTMLASGANDNSIRIWNVKSGHAIQSFATSNNSTFSVAWSPDGSMLASGSDDNTIKIWDVSIGRPTNILEGHNGYIICVSFSSEGHLLASKSEDGTIRIWRTDIWESIATLKETSSYAFSSLAFHPNAPILATLGRKDTVIRIWDIDLSTLLGSIPALPVRRYANAKVVLVGDSGVGKSGLSLVLTGQTFISTDSTHGRKVWTFDSKEMELDDGRRETREILLWDLAGQPGYRLIHQLHLNEVTVALVVFDARSETDPFVGLHHWDRALRLAQRLQGNAAPQLKKFLVAARVDRGGRSVSRARIDSLLHELGFIGYFETSAKEGWGIQELIEAIRESIEWETLTKVTSSELFQHIKSFLIAEKESNRLLSTVDDLYRTFVKSNPMISETEELRLQFETCIGRVESRGLIRQLSFGNLVLLQPELLDTYASALVNAVKDEPDGLGSIAEEKARAGNFPVPKDEQLKDKEQEKLLLIAMVEDLLRHEIALREQSDEGSYLVFPSQSTRENPDLPDPEGKAVIFTFEGPVLNIYATLAVRLSHSGVFKRKDLWKDAITYTAKAGGICGMFLRNIGEGRGELTLFFDQEAGEDTRFYFEDYIQTHLQRRAIAQSIQRRRTLVCSKCGFILTNQLVQLLMMHGSYSLDCPVCHTHISLLKEEEQIKKAPDSLVSEMDTAADIKREREVALSVLQGRKELGDFDVFLCHNEVDKAKVRRIGERLQELGILPWLDEWELRPGLPWQRVLEMQISQIKSVAVFVGKEGVGPWQHMELEAFLREFVSRGCPVIPVLLSDASRKPQLPIFLKGMTWVDFRKRKSNSIEQLVWGITGKRITAK